MALVVAVLVALLSQSFASVQSIVMRATVSAYMAPICDGGLDEAKNEAGTRPSDHRPSAPHGHETVCPFCAVSAHVPIIEHAAPLRVAARFVFVAFDAVANHSPRGPPPSHFRARAPPVDPLTA